MQTADFKNILVGLTDDPRLASPALDFAFDLAMLSNAHLTVQIDAVEAVPIDAMTYEATFMVEAVNDRIDAEAQAVAARVREDAHARGLSCRVLLWTAPAFALRRNFGELGRTHDLAVLDAGRDGLIGGYTEAALFESGRPVIVVPDPINPLAIRRCLIAWDGSADAARALNDALPLLRSMDEVEIVSVQTDCDEDRLKGIGLHLQRHGIDATRLTLPLADGSVGATIAARVEQTRPGLVVMGAYSHSPVREWMLGGTTRSMLTKPPATLFMSH